MCKRDRLKPVGLTNPHQPDRKPYAVVQLRRDNALGPLYNLVGFQTKMKYAAQTLSLIHLSEPTRPYSISYAVFCLKK